MGNSPLTIAVKIDDGKNRGIVAGSILYGKIYLSNKQPSTVHAQSIQLKLIGKEDSTIEYTTTETTGHPQQHHGGSHRNNHHSGNHRNNHHGGSRWNNHHGGSRWNNHRGGRRRNNHHESDTFTGEERDNFSKTIYTLDYPVKSFPDGIVPRGQFEFPFALQLPKTLPSSMKAQSGRSKCAVYYEVIAEVYQQPNTLFHKNPNAKEEVTIFAVPNNSATQSSQLLPTEIIRMSSCRCCSCFSCTKIGSMALQAKLDRSTLLYDSPPSPRPTTSWNRNASAFRATDTGHNLVGFRFRCQNKSKATVRAVKATITEYIDWSVNGRTETVKTVLATLKKSALEYSELDPSWRGPLPFEEHRFDSETSRLLQSNPWRTIDPSLEVDPTMTTDTYRGSSIKVRHVLSLSIVPEHCFTTIPEVSAPIHIYRNPAAFSHDGFSFEQPQTAVHHTHEASAPVEDVQFDEYLERPPATSPTSASAASQPATTAPSSIYDDGNSAEAIPVVEAQVLPADWNAQTAELITIPIAEATVIEA